VALEGPVSFCAMAASQISFPNCVLIPILYLKGISTGDFEDALIALLGRDAGGLSASTIGRLKEARSEEHARWSKRDLSAAISTSGSTAFTCRPASKTPRNAC